MDNIIQSKSYAFAIRVVKLYKHLAESKKEFILSKQLLRAGTSIGANVEEAIGAQSRPDFLTKLTIAYKETRETAYWLRLLKDTNFLSQKEFTSINNDVQELLRLLTSIQKSTKSKS